MKPHFHSKTLDIKNNSFFTKCVAEGPKIPKYRIFLKNANPGFTQKIPLYLQIL